MIWKIRDYFIQKNAVTTQFLYKLV